jgi:hypothetical protein
LSHKQAERDMQNDRLTNSKTSKQEITQRLKYRKPDSQISGDRERRQRAANMTANDRHTHRHRLFDRQ